jgi:hypothetical protein
MSRSPTPVVPLQPAILYRIVRENPPTDRDFTSKAALGLVDADADPEVQRLESGLSMYRTLAQARRKARAFPFLGAYIAVVRLDPSDDVRVERTTSSAGHYTVWGEASVLLRRVVAVEPAGR